MTEQCRFSKELLGLDEAADVLDHAEFQLLTARQKTATDRLEERRLFTLEYREAVAKLSDAANARQAVLLAKVNTVLPLVWEQKTVKVHTPPGASIWRGNTRGEWWGHFPPYKRVVEKLVEHGCDEKECIKAVLRALWTQYNEKFARPANACPVVGLFDA